MIRFRKSLALSALLATGAAPSAPDGGGHSQATYAPAVRLPGFAAELADVALASGPAAWPAIPRKTAWAAITHSAPADRQAARWALALSLIASGYGADASGVLDVMASDDPDLTLVPAWQRARGVALVESGHAGEAVAALDMPMLKRDPEACLWRMRALAESADTARAALGDLRCAMPALDVRKGARRTPFVLAAVRAALAIDRPRPALGWLATLPDGDSAANLLRGKAYLALGRAQDGRLRLARVALTGTCEERAEARLSQIENGVATGSMKAAEARKQLDTMRFSWRGDDIERRANELAMRLADNAHDIAGSLAAGATLFRYFALGAEMAPLTAKLQAQLAAALRPDAKLPIDQAAGLFWDYRDLAPAGIDGLRLVEGLTARLQAAGLYGRAADLLQYRLDATAQDIEKGPLSVRVASLRVLSGDPIAAIRVLRATDSVAFPNDMIADRRRIEAAALDLAGKPNEAIAALDDIPDAAAERGEIYWRARDWQRLVANGEPSLPKAGRLSDVGQAIVLRHAIGLAMLGREDALTRLGARYGAAFATLPTAQTFALLTGNPSQADPDALAKAMAALPSVSPAGEFGDLLDQGGAAMVTAAR